MPSSSKSLPEQLVESQLNLLQKKSHLTVKRTEQQYIDVGEAAWKAAVLTGTDNLFFTIQEHLDAKISAISKLINLRMADIVEYWLSLTKPEGSPLIAALKESFKGEVLQKEVKAITAEVEEEFIVVYAEHEDKDGYSGRTPLFVVSSWTEEEVMFFFRDQYDKEKMKMYFQTERAHPDFKYKMGVPAHMATIFTDFLNKVLVRDTEPSYATVNTMSADDMRRDDADSFDFAFLRAWEILKRE